MNEKEARKYLKRKDKPVTRENIEEVVRKGKIYGDPVAMCQ